MGDFRIGSKILDTISSYGKGIMHESSEGAEQAKIIAMKHCPPPLFKSDVTIAKQVANLFYLTAWMIAPPFLMGYALKSILASAFQNKFETPTKSLSIEKSLDKRDKVLEYLNKQKELSGQSGAVNFMKTQDAAGKTFFHHLFDLKENPQIDGNQGLKAFLKALDEPDSEGTFLNLMHVRDNDGQTPIGIAIERGHAGVISTLYSQVTSPLENSEIENDEKAKNIKNAIDNTIQALADPDSKKKLMEKCPGNVEYDKIHHISAGLHRLICHGHGPDLIAAIEKCENKSNLPREILGLYNYAKANPELLIQRELSQKCKNINSESEIDNIYKQWGVNQEVRNPNSLISFSNLGKTQAEKMQNLINNSLLESDEKKRNGSYNLLMEILNPFAAYNNRFDFNNSNNAGILHQLVDLAIVKREPPIDHNDLKMIINKLIMKYPDYLTNTVDGKTILEYLDEKEDNPMVGLIKQVIDDTSQNLDEKIFENTSKASLKYYLENKGKEFSATRG